MNIYKVKFKNKIGASGVFSLKAETINEAIQEAKKIVGKYQSILIEEKLMGYIKKYH